MGPKEKLRKKRRVLDRTTYANLDRALRPQSAHLKTLGEKPAMATAKTDDRTRDLLKSLLDRIEADCPPLPPEMLSDRKDKTTRPDNVFSVRLKTAPPPRLPPAPVIDEIDRLVLPVMRDEPARIAGVPVMVLGATFVAAAIALPLLGLALWPHAPTPFGREITIARTADARRIEIPMIEPLPQLVAPPAQISRAEATLAAPVAPEVAAPVATSAPPLEEPPAVEPVASPLAHIIEPKIVLASPQLLPPPPMLAPPPRAAVSPRIIVAPQLAVRSGQRLALPIRIEAPEGATPVERIVVRGLPRGAILEKAARGPAGSLVIAADALASSVLDLTAAVAGETDIEIELLGAGETMLARTTAMLAIVPAHVREALPSPRVDLLVTRAQGMLTDGDIAGARLILERVAEGGSAAAALLLGETYDPAMLGSIGSRGVVGVAGNKAQAQLWYERARTLGHDGAEARMKRLQGP